MRILNICAYTWQTGGPPKVIFDHTQIALEQGHQVDILSPISPGEEPYTLPEGARLILCRRTPGISRFFREFSVELYQYLKRHVRDYDVIHCHGLWHFGTLMPFLLDKTVAKVVSVHGALNPKVYVHNRWKKQLMDTLTQRVFLRRADLIHIYSPDERADVVRYLGQPHPNIVIIPNGVKTSDFDQSLPKGAFRQKFGIPANRKMVLFMSRLDPIKGLDLLLPGFREYLRQHPKTILILAGSDGGYEAAARQFIDQHQLGDSIRLVGMLTGDDKKTALADANLFTLPSYSEGFSMAVLEAMASGTPTLVSDRVGFGEAIRQHDAACLIELSADGIRAGLDEMLGNEQVAQRRSQNATKLVREQYDIDIVAKKMLDEYAKISPASRLTA